MQTAPRATKSRWLVPAIVLAAGLAVRLAPWPHVFANGEVILRADTDPHYHVLRAERLLNHAPGAPWVDPWLGWPAGAEVPWPPLFDATIAAAARLFSAAPSRDQLARAGALLVVVWGMITLPLVAALGRRLTGRGGAGWVAAAFVALIPAVVQHSEVGRVDQHGAELMLFTAILLAFVTAAQEPARATRCGVVLGLLFALAFWTWLGSAVLLAFPAAFAGLWYVMAPRGEVAARAGVRAVAVGGGVGALLLVFSVSALGPPDALLRGSLLGVSGLHVAMVGGVGVFGALLLVARRWPPLEVSRARRAAVVATAVALPIALSLGLSAPLRDGVREGLTAFAAGNPWYASVGEFKPLLLTGDRPFSSELLGVVGSFGLTIPLALLAIPAWRSRLRTGSPAWPVAFEALLLVLFATLAFARQRFMGYATIPIGLAGAAGLDWLADRLPQRVRDRPLGRPLAFAAGVALCVVPVLPEYGLPWSAGRPVVASPFGTEGGFGSMERWARFWYGTGRNGLVEAGAWTVSSGADTRSDSTFRSRP